MDFKSRLCKAIGILAVVAALSTALVVGIVRAAPADWDTNGDGFIDRSEVIAAIDVYLFSDTLSREELLEIIDLYLFGDPVVQPEADAKLSELNLQNLQLAPEFSPATNTYTATVPDPGASTTVTAVPANPAATVSITVDGAPAASGDTFGPTEGSRVVVLEVTSADGTATKTYTITILTASEWILHEGDKYLTYTDDWQMTPAVEALIPLAQAEGEVHFTAYDQDHVDAICAAFEARFNIRCTGRGLSAGQIVAMLNFEREAGEAPTDVVYMSVVHMAQYIDEGYGAEVDWASLGADARRVWDADNVDGNALGVANNQYTNFYRTDIYDVGDLPRTVHDWLDPRYKDEACAPSFLFRAGNGFMAFRHDADEMIDVHKRMIDENGLLVTGSCNEFILSGEKPLVYMGYGNPPALLDSGVIGQFWNTGQGINMFNTAVASNAQHPNAARLLAAWHSSKEASQITWGVDGTGWAAYGHAPAGLLAGGAFADVKMVFESVPVARQRGINADYFGERVFSAPTPTPRTYATSLSQEGFDCFFDRRLFQGESRVAGCSGWFTDTIHKWKNLAPDVWISPDSKGRYITITKEVLAYLSPILRMDFNYVDDEADAELIVFAGSSKAGDDSLLVDPVDLFGCTDAIGCARWFVDRETGVISGGRWVVWDDESLSDRSVKSTTLHEALHVIGAVHHSSNFKSIMRDLRNTRLPYMLPYEEDMYRLWAEPFVQPGMLASELRDQITNTPPDRTATDAEVAIDAFLNLVTHDRVSFDVTLNYSESGCALYNDSGTAVLFGGWIWPRWNTEDFRRENARWRAGIDAILIAIAQHGTPVSRGTVYETPRTPAAGDDYSKVTIGYTTDIDADGYVQRFTVNWQWTHVDPQESFCRSEVIGSNFRYSKGTVPASSEDPDTSEREAFRPPPEKVPS